MLKKARDVSLGWIAAYHHAVTHIPDALVAYDSILACKIFCQRYNEIRGYKYYSSIEAIHLPSCLPLLMMSSKNRHPCICIALSAIYYVVFALSG